MTSFEHAAQEFDHVRDLYIYITWRSSEEIVALEATLYGVCERAAQRSRSICCGCEKDRNNHWTFTMEVVKSVFVVFATRGHDILYSDWGRS